MEPGDIPQAGTKTLWYVTATQKVVTDTIPVVTLFPRDYDAVLFDLDGVIPQTARVHAAPRRQEATESRTGEASRWAPRRP